MKITKKTKLALTVGATLSAIIFGFTIVNQNKVKIVGYQNITGDVCSYEQDPGHCEEEYLGLTIEDAQAKAEELTFRHRIVEDNNSETGITSDIGSKRVNFYIRDGIVVNARFY